MLINTTNEPQDGSQDHAFEGASSNGNNQGMQTSPEGGDSSVENVLKVIEENCSEIFFDQFSDPFACIKESNKVMGINSSDFNDFILLKFLDKYNKAVSKETLKNAIRIIRARIASTSNDTKKMFVRVAQDVKGDYWYDLGGGKAVMINQDGWSIASDPPSIFRRYKSQSPQVEPEHGGSLDEFISILNLSSKDDEILLKVYLVCSFIYGFPHPILIVFGQHGAAKTTLFRFLKALIDPSSIGTLSPITNIKEFIQVISHHWAAFFDNLSKLKIELSDALCRVCTGDGFSKRKLYCDDDDIIYSFQHLVGINGINNIASKSDLLDRSLLTELSRISEDQRKTEEYIQGKFDAMRARVVGACFDAMSKAIKIYPTVELKESPRMSDFARWGFAVAESLGIGGDNFLDAYNRNISKQNMEAIDASPVAYAVKTMIERDPVGVVEATPMYIFNRLINEANQAEFDYTRDRYWPTNVRWFSRMLTEVIPNLKKIGIVVERGKNDNRWMKIENINRAESSSAIDQAKKFERGEIGYEELDVDQIPF